MSNVDKYHVLDLLMFGILAAVSFCLGLLHNPFSDKPLPLVYESKAERLQRSVSKLANTEPSKMVAAQDFPLHEISLDDFRAFVKEKRGLVLDARPDIFYRLSHVPGALSLPRDDFEKGYTLLKAQLEANMSQPMIIYCSDESCEDSELVYQALTNLGCTQISVFRGGWDAWTKAGYPDEK
jgi:3-mercaptopyruvate sulfurtransferase SseA